MELSELRESVKVFCVDVLYLVSREQFRPAKNYNIMESKIQIDIDMFRQERILIQLKHTDDLRDKLIAMFLQTAIPDGGSWRIRDGYCRISLISDDGGSVAEITPIHPIDMPKHIEEIQRNCDNWRTATRPVEYPAGLEVTPEQPPLLVKSGLIKG